MAEKARFIVSIITFMSLLASGTMRAHAWTYTSHGDNWQGLCRSGKHQSPIDISLSGSKSSNPVNSTYPLLNKRDPQDNNNQLISINAERGVCSFEGHRYKALSFHFHAPSEHTFNGKHFPLEMHIVHEDRHKNKAVIAVIFEKNNNTAHFIKEFYWEALKGAGSFTYLDKTLNFSFLNTPSSHYFVYEGSFTTPPCTEGVKWFVLTRPYPLSTQQIETWRRFGHAPNGNYRITQPLNNRVLKSF
jgi:carbonic anhydrase